MQKLLTTFVVGSVLAIAMASYFWAQGGGAGGSIVIAPGTGVGNGGRVGPSSGNAPGPGVGTNNGATVGAAGSSGGTAPGTSLGANNGFSDASGSIVIAPGTGFGTNNGGIGTGGGMDWMVSDINPRNDPNASDILDPWRRRR